MTISGEDVLSASGFRYLNIAHYDGGSELEREMLAPPVPAIYLWVHDFIRLLGLRPNLVDEAIARFSGQQGRQWPLGGDHFTQGELRAMRPDLPVARREVIVREISSETSVGRSIAALATFQQRPLYCGISVNFGRRISEHLQQKTNFSNALTTINLSECAVLWMQINEAQADEMSLRNRQIDESSGDADPLETDDEHLAKQVPALNAFESLMIRVSMPIINKSLDS